MTRKECLDRAAECVLQNRQDQYGDVEDCFKKIARLWNAYLPPVIELEPYDVACMMALLKIARIQANPKHGDSWVDLAGYAACGADIAVPAPFRYDKPETESGCCQNGNDQPEEPEFKPGDAVEWNSIASDGLPAVYLREFGDFGHCVVRLSDGRERIVSKVDLRKAEANYPENPDSSTAADPGFKSGDRAQAFNGEEWVDCRYIRWNEPEGRHVVQYKGCRCSIDPESLRPTPKAEGCEALVEKDAPLCGERCEEFIPGLGTCESCRHAREHDAPQTPQELYQHIVDCNPSVYPRKPTGEELAEMAEEEEKHG